MLCYLVVSSYLRCRLQRYLSSAAFSIDFHSDAFLFSDHRVSLFLLSSRRWAFSHFNLYFMLFIVWYCIFHFWLKSQTLLFVIIPVMWLLPLLFLREVWVYLLFILINSKTFWLFQEWFSCISWYLLELLIIPWKVLHWLYLKTVILNVNSRVVIGISLY
jgi:hypothetical protein